MRRKRRTKRFSDATPDYLIMGLGNPGEKYQGTRHNVGAEVVYLLEEHYDVRLRKSKASALCAEAKSGNRNVVIAVPETYMNESGLAARKLMNRYNISEPAQLIVIHDELDLPVGKIKIKVGGGLAGHNGLRSIESHVHSREFARIRIGVGAIHEGQRGRDYVLSRPGKADRQALEHSKSKAVEALNFIQTHGHQAAMNKFNA